MAAIVSRCCIDIVEARSFSPSGWTGFGPAFGLTQLFRWSGMIEQVNLKVIAVVTGCLLFAGILGGILSIGQALLVAAVAAAVTLRIRLWTRVSRRRREARTCQRDRGQAD